jgi:Fe2+ transport system protein FeoA
MTDGNMIAIQDELIAKVVSCQTGHIRRVRKGARATAGRKLMALGFAECEAVVIVQDAMDVANLERNAAEG